MLGATITVHLSQCLEYSIMRVYHVQYDSIHWYHMQGIYIILRYQWIQSAAVSESPLVPWTCKVTTLNAIMHMHGTSQCMDIYISVDPECTVVPHACGMTVSTDMTLWESPHAL